jgi:hypothetical protein
MQNMKTAKEDALDRTEKADQKLIILLEKQAMVCSFSYLYNRYSSSFSLSLNSNKALLILNFPSEINQYESSFVRLLFLMNNRLYNMIRVIKEFKRLLKQNLPKS